MKHWSRDLYLERRRHLRQAVLGRMSPGKVKEVQKVLLAKIADHRSDDHVVNSIDGFLNAVAAIELHARFGGLQSRQVDSLATYARGLLTLSRVKAGRSNVAFAFGDLFRALSEAARADGHPHIAAAHIHSALQLGRGETADGPAYLQTELAWVYLRQGCPAQALDILDIPLEGPVLDDSAHLARRTILKIDAARLLGDISRSGDLKSGLMSGLKPGPIMKYIAWLVVLSDYARLQDASIITSNAMRGGSLAGGIPQLEAKLLCSAMQAHEYSDRLPPLATILRKVGPMARKSRLGRAAASFADASDATLDYQERFLRMTALVTDARRLENLSEELLILAAVLRWFSRNRAYDAATWVATIYRSLTTSWSNSSDPLHVVKDLLETNFTGTDQRKESPEWVA